MKLMPRLYLHVIVMDDDVEVLKEWAKIQATIHRKDADVIEVGATLVVDNNEGRPICSILEV